MSVTTTTATTDTANHDAIRAQILEIATREIDLKGDGIEAIDGLDLAERFDSMERLQLVVAIEDHFEVALDPTEDQQLVTIDDLVRAVIAARLQGDGERAEEGL